MLLEHSVPTFFSAGETGRHAHSSCGGGGADTELTVHVVPAVQSAWTQHVSTHCVFEQRPERQSDAPLQDAPGAAPPDAGGERCALTAGTQ
jgi:hypothetical protein